MSRLIVAVAGAVILAAGVPVSGSAEPSEGSAGASKAAASTAPRVPASQRSRTHAARSRPWSIEDALPSRPRLDAAPDPAKREFGQIPVQNGTLSLETKSQVNAHDSPERRRIPGLEVENQNKPSYLGFSLSVPTKLFSTPMPSAAPTSAPPE